MFKKSFGILQKIGRSLMLPVALLPAAGILLAFGNALQNPQLLQAAPFLNAHILQSLAGLWSKPVVLFSPTCRCYSPLA